MNLSALPCFDELLEMNRQDPEQLESLRQKLTDEVLYGKTPEQRRPLDQLLFRIDAERKRCHNPLGLCIRYSNMMHERFWMMSDLLKSFTGPDVKELKVELSSKPVELTEGRKRAAVVSLAEYRAKIT